MLHKLIRRLERKILRSFDFFANCLYWRYAQKHTWRASLDLARKTLPL